jgi:glycosyltransferase involved in cell wall biosynthesis
MRILVVHDIGVLEGGAEILLTRTSAELRRQGHEVRTLTSDSPIPTFADATYRANDATIVGKLSHYLYNGSAKKALLRELRAFKPDIVHLHTLTKASPAIMDVLADVPTVMTLHDYGLMYPLLHKVLPQKDFCGYGDVACCPRHAGILRYYFESLRVRLYRIKRKKITSYIVPSRFVAAVASKLGYEPVVLLRNSIELAAPSKKKVARSPYTILFVGRLEAEKGAMELFEAVKLVLRHVPDARLVIVGTGTEERALRQRIARDGLQDSIELRGQLPYADIEDLYRSATVLAVPSLWPEPFGLIGPEAMQFGLPVVSSGRGGMSDWADDGRNALIADPQNTAAFADALTRILRDGQLRATLAQQALKDAREFSMQRYVTELIAVYERARTRHKA